jgi:hypothetical protein
MSFIKLNKLKIIQVVRNTHRLFGFFLSLLFFMWCASGFVMMYKEFPSVSKKEYVAVRDYLKVDTSKLASINNWEYKYLDSCAEMSMYQILDKTLIKIIDNNGKVLCLDAHTGNAIAPINENELDTLMVDYFGNETSIKKVTLIKELDQWIPRTKFLPYMPIYKVLLNDKEQTTCYISSKSGEIIQKLTFEDKVWAWLGPIPHWIYFKTLRINTDAWRYVVISLSSLGVILALLGIVLGINRTRISRQKNKTITPYKKKWFRWHHYLGFTFGVFIFTWILSGLFSMNPFKWASEDTLNESEASIWKGGSYSHFNSDNSLKIAISKLIEKHHSKEIKFTLYNAQPYLVSYNHANTVKYIQLNDNGSIINAANMSTIKSMILKLKPNTTIMASDILNDYDDYYYNKHRTLPLPIYRFKLKDNQCTWYYVNPQTLNVVKKMQTDNKVERWLYNGLHSFDFPILFFKRPLWDVVVAILLLGCTILCFTGLKLTLNNLFRNIKKRI